MMAGIKGHTTCAVEGVVAEMVTYLTDEEREYLRQLFAESAARDPSMASEHTLQLQSPSVERDLLLRMLGRLRSELVATDGHYCLRFKLEVVPSPYGGPAVLRLLPPTITDRQGVERPARVRPAPGDIRLIDGAGRLVDPQVIDISNSGIALRVNAEEPAQPGMRLADLQLKLPGQQPFTVTGRIVRTQREEPGVQKFGLQFEQIESEAQAALRYYVFDHYDLVS